MPAFTPSSTQRITHQANAGASGALVLPCAQTIKKFKHVDSSFARQRPAFEKLLVGPMMIFGEMITGGHYLEVLRLGKQMTTGRAECPSYISLHRSFVSETGFLGAFYRGFLPWGLMQCLKGVPVLFVQNESMYQLQARGGWSSSTAEKASGFLGGAVQGVFVCPLQKIKVSVVACPTMNLLPPQTACKQVIKTYGIGALYDGIVPMMMRRSLDWGIRFTVSSEVKRYLLERKREANEEEKLALHELIACGLVGGAFSALTHPIDNIITNSQKPMPPGAARDLVSVVKQMVRESGTKAFTRGFAIKIIDNAYHMAWMYGIGTVVYDYMRSALTQEQP